MNPSFKSLNDLQENLILTNITINATDPLDDRSTYNVESINGEWASDYFSYLNRLITLVVEEAEANLLTGKNTNQNEICIEKYVNYFEAINKSYDCREVQSLLRLLGNTEIIILDLFGKKNVVDIKDIVAGKYSGVQSEIMVEIRRISKSIRDSLLNIRQIETTFTKGKNSRKRNTKPDTYFKWIANQIILEKIYLGLIENEYISCQLETFKLAFSGTEFSKPTSIKWFMKNPKNDKVSYTSLIHFIFLLHKNKLIEEEFIFKPGKRKRNNKDIYNKLVSIFVSPEGRQINDPRKSFHEYKNLKSKDHFVKLERIVCD